MLKGIALFLTAVLAYASSEGPAERPVDAELAKLADVARSAPPEFAAYGLTRIANARQEGNRDWRVAMLTEAFEIAAGAREALPMRPMAANAGGGGNQRRFDRLTLQTAAVRALLGLDAAVAREYFLRLPMPTVRPARCEDQYLDDPADYFSMAAQVANVAFNAKERAREDHLVLAQIAVQAVSSPAEIAPAARMIADLRATPEQADALALKLADALSRVNTPAHAFKGTASEVESAVAALAARTRSGASLQSALRDYKQRHSKVECNAGEAAVEPADAQRESTAVKAEFEALRRKFILLIGNGTRVLTEAERNTDDWKRQLLDYVREVEEWRPASGADAQILQLKSEVYVGLVGMTPPGPEKRTLLDTYVGLLRSTGDQPASWTEWFSTADALLRATRSMNSSEERLVLEAYERSGHPALMLFARLERVTPANWLPPASPEP